MRAVFVQRDFYPSYPRPRAALRRSINTGASSHNAAIHSNQVRVSSGATFTSGGVMHLPRGWSTLKPVAGPEIADRLPQPGDYAPPHELACTTAGTVYCGLLALADRGEPLPTHGDFAKWLGLSLDSGPHGASARIGNTLRLLDERGFVVLGYADGYRTLSIPATEQVLVGTVRMGRAA